MSDTKTIPELIQRMHRISGALKTLADDMRRVLHESDEAHVHAEEIDLAAEMIDDWARGMMLEEAVK